MSKYTAVYTGNVVGIYKDGEQMTIEQIASDLNTKAVEPVQRCNCCGYLVTDSEHKGCLRAAKQEPAQVVPAFWASENILKEYLRDNISCVLTTTKCAANTVPLYTVPPAIVETRHKLILVCEYLETVGLMFVSPRVISSQIRAILEAGNEN